ncbi:MAG: hypothetical protein AMXMBFR53_08210 [Gemmatimonadota bacterium]
MKIAFLWMGQGCTVAAPAAIAGDLAALFPLLARPAGPSAVPDVVVERVPAGFAVVAGGVPEPCASAVEAVSAAELAVTRHLLAAERRHCHLHASAALAGSGGAVVALGPSGSGKSTLAYAWYRLGRPVFGDDVVAVDDRGRLHPFPRPLKVHAARLREAGEAPEETVAWDPSEEDVWVDPLPRAGWAEGGAEVAVLAEIRFVPGAETRLEAVRDAQRLRMLLDAVHQTGTSREDSLDRLIGLAEGAAVFRVEFGRAAEAAPLLLDIAGSRQR